MSWVQSTSSSRIQLSRTGCRRRAFKPGLTAFQEQRTQKIYDEDGNDVTPKPLLHESYSVISDSEHLLNLDSIISKQRSGTMHSIMSPSRGFKSSSILVRSPSMVTTAFNFEDMESLMSLSSTDTLAVDDSDRAPSPFCLPSYDPTTVQSLTDDRTVILRESDTFFIFELPQLTVDLNTPEGQAVKEANERYDYITTVARSHRKVADAETQTTRIYMKSQSTYLARHKRMNSATFVNNWVMYDTYNTPGLLEERNGIFYERSQEEMQRIKNSQNRFKLPKLSNELNLGDEDQMTRLYKNPSFASGVRVMERIIASKLYLDAQKRFKGLIKEDPFSLDLKITYSLNLLWTYTHNKIRGRSVNCIRWNYTNDNVLAAGYGSNPKEFNGYILIWSIKNPLEPERVYKLDSPIADIDWSREKPNQLAIGCYDGTLRIIDVTSRDLAVLRMSSRETSSTFSPHWQVQWWLDDDNQEHIYTSNQDGGIFCYQTNEDFAAMEMMKITRTDDNISGVQRMNYCTEKIPDIPIKKNPGAILLRRHPSMSNIYLIGSDEGCIHRCSITYLTHHIDSYSAHDGPICALQYSPFCTKILLTAGADWCTRIWADGIAEPLITLSTRMSYVTAAAWSPINSTVIASCVNNEICIWDIKRKTHRPASVTVLASSQQLVLLEFTSSGRQLVVADADGLIYVYSCERMPFPPFNQTDMLVDAIVKNLVTKPELLKKLHKIGEPF